MSNMISICPKCSRTNKVENLTCAHCGASMLGAQVVRPVGEVNAPPQQKIVPPPTRPATPTAKPKQKGTCINWIVFMLFLLIITLVIVNVLRSKDQAPARTKVKTHDRLGAYVVAENFVESRLKSPGSA